MLEKIMTLFLDHPGIDLRIREMCRVEPRIQAVLERAVFHEITPQYDRIRSYHVLRAELQQLVGWHAAHTALRNSADYQLILEALIDLLPPDASESDLDDRASSPEARASGPEASISNPDARKSNIDARKSDPEAGERDPYSSKRDPEALECSPKRRKPLPFIHPPFP